MNFCWQRYQGRARPCRPGVADALQQLAGGRWQKQWLMRLGVGFLVVVAVVVEIPFFDIYQKICHDFDYMWYTYTYT